MVRECDELRNKRTALEVNLRQKEQVYKDENIKCREMFAKRKLLENKEKEIVSKNQQITQLKEEIEGKY